MKKQSAALEELIKLKEEKLRALENQLYLKENLPHKYGFKFFPWQRKFLDDTSPDIFLTKANQIGGSTIQIIKMITLATEPDLWLKFFKHRPELFLYLYPSKQLFQMEFSSKWIKTLLPKGEFKKSGQYAWEVIGSERNPDGIRFTETGVECFFRFYSQSPSVLQAFTLDLVYCDEEVPIKFYDEISNRRISKSGLLSAVFTPVLGQDFFYDVMEGKGDREKLKWASKYRVSLYDCLKYDDGTTSHITNDVIKRRIALCKSEAEVQRRVMGRFSKDVGLVYPFFDASKDIMEPKPVPRDWIYYAGIDLGSGGDNDPAAIIVIAVSPQYDEVIVVDGYLGDGAETTALDTANYYKDKIATKYNIACAYYDSADRDFYVFASGMGLPMQKANKVRDTGIRIINILMKNRLIKFFDCPATDYLVRDFSTMSFDRKDKKDVGHICDALRYALTSLPLDFTKIGINIVGGEEGAASGTTFLDVIKKGRNENIFWNGEVDHTKERMNRIKQMDESNERGDFYEEWSEYQL